jgi:hypothetical protein
MNRRKVSTMPMLPSDLSRKFLLDVTASGHVFIRERGSARRDGALPTFSTDTYDEAEALIIRFCRRANDSSGLYCLNEVPADLDALGDVSHMFRVEHERRIARKVG